MRRAVGASPFAVNKANESPLDVAKEAGHTSAAAAVRAARRAAIDDAESAAAQLIQEALAERDAARDAARVDRHSGPTADSGGDGRGSMLAAKSDTVITVPVDPRSHDGSQSLSSYESGMYDSPGEDDSTARGGASGSLSVPVDPCALDAPNHPQYPGHISADKAPSGSTALTARPVGDVLFDVASVANFDGPGQSVAGGRLSDVISEAYTMDDTESESVDGWDEEEEEEEEEEQGRDDSAELEGTGPMEGRAVQARLGSVDGGAVVKEGGVVKNGREGRARGGGQRQLVRRASRGSSRGSAKRGGGRNACGPAGGSWPRPATVIRAAVPALSPAKAVAARASAGAAPPLPAQVKPGQGAALSGYWLRNSKASGGAGGASVGVPGTAEHPAAAHKSGGRGRGAWTKGEAIQFLMEGPIVRPRHRSPPLSARNRGQGRQGRVHAEPVAPQNIAQHLQQQLGRVTGDGDRALRRKSEAGGSKPPSPPSAGEPAAGGAATTHHPTPSQYADINNLVNTCDTADISTALASAQVTVGGRGRGAAAAAGVARSRSPESRPTASDVALPLWKLTNQQSRARAGLSPRPHTARALTDTSRTSRGQDSPSHAAERSYSPSGTTPAPTQGRCAGGAGGGAGGAGGGGGRFARAMISCLGPVPLSSHPLLSPRLASGPHSGSGATPATSKRMSSLSTTARVRGPATGAVDHSTGSSTVSSRGSNGAQWLPPAPANRTAGDPADASSSVRPQGSRYRGGPLLRDSFSSGSEGGVEQRRGPGLKLAQHSAHSSVPLSASCSLSTADKGRHVFQRAGVIEPGSDGGAAVVEGGLGDGLHQGARALSDLGRLGSRSDERLLSSSSSVRAREATASQRGPREGWQSGTHEVWPTPCCPHRHACMNEQHACQLRRTQGALVRGATFQSTSTVR